MAEVADGAARSHDFLLRRLHSLSGIVPVGAFLVVHLLVNASIVFNTPKLDFFQDQVNRIHSLGPVLVPVEILFIFLPILFHAVLGVKIWLEGKPNTLHYRYWGNVRYRLQRVTGVIALVFIMVHLWHMHWLGDRFGGGFFEPEDASRTAAGAMQAFSWWAVPLYAIGIASAVFHFSNGIWTFLITWGVTVGPESQRKSGYICAALGAALMLAGLSSMTGLMRYPNARLPEGKHAAQTEQREVAGVSADGVHRLETGAAGPGAAEN